MNLAQSIIYCNNWYKRKEVQKMILSFMGVQNFHGVDWNGDFCSSERLRRATETIRNEYSVVKGLQIQREKSGVARSIKNYEIPYYWNFENPVLEILNSFWQREIFWNDIIVPNRGIWYIDIEYDSKKFPGQIALNQVECFEQMETTYQLIKYWLNNFGINHFAVKTVKGYNFIGQVPCGTTAFWKLIELGRHVETTVYYRQLTPRFRKRDRPVPFCSEAIFRGSMRVALFFTNQIINEARKNSNIKIEFSDMGDEQISFDPTQLLRPCDTACFGIPGSPYLNFVLQRDKIGHHIADNTSIPIRIIRSVNNHEYFNNNIGEMINCCNNYDYAAQLISQQDGQIPDCSEGLNRLIEQYEKSQLIKLHQWIDQEKFEPYDRWPQTYRNYNGICYDNPDLAQMIHNPNPTLLQPGKLNYFINALFDRGWSPKHIAGLLASIYTLEHGWGNFFIKYDPFRHAIGWVTIILGQRYH